MPPVFPDHPYEDDLPPRYVCHVHRYADDDTPCDECEDGRDATEGEPGSYRERTYLSAVARPTQRCSEHRLDYYVGAWCPLCFEDAQREAKALGETMPWRRAVRQGLARD